MLIFVWCIKVFWKSGSVSSLFHIRCTITNSSRQTHIILSNLLTPGIQWLLTLNVIFRAELRKYSNSTKLGKHPKLSDKQIAHIYVFDKHSQSTGHFYPHFKSPTTACLLIMTLRRQHRRGCIYKILHCAIISVKKSNLFSWLKKKRKRYSVKKDNYSYWKKELNCKDQTMHLMWICEVTFVKTWNCFFYYFAQAIEMVMLWSTWGAL